MNAEDDGFDEAAAHVHFSKACFNAAWTLIEKAGRSAADDEEMIRLNQAALWHWTQRPDCTDRNRAIGYWQAARIRSILGHVQEATRYAGLCERHSVGLAPFYRASSQEALARAAMLRGDDSAARAHTMQARVLVQGIVDDDQRRLVLADLADLADRMNRAKPDRSDAASCSAPDTQ